MRWLLDSSVVIDMLRGVPAAIAFVQSMPGGPRMSVVTISELRDGERGARETARIDNLLAEAELYDVTKEIAELSGNLMRRFRRSHGLTTPDSLIAATAIHHKLQLATLNLKHFPMFPDLRRPY